MVQKKFSKTLNCFYILIPDANVVDSVEDLLYLLKYTKEITKKELRKTSRLYTPYNPTVEMKLPNWEEFVA